MSCQFVFSPDLFQNKRPDVRVNELIVPSVSIGVREEVESVRQPALRVTPKDVSKLVEKDGKVRLSTYIQPGERFIYARSVLGNTERYIKINVYTQEVVEIDKSEYPKGESFLGGIGF